MLAFLHTSPVHVETFGLLVRQLGESVPVRHEVRQDLLLAALAAGTSPEFVRSALGNVLRELARDGAKVIVCTCSTIGGLAEAALVPNCTVMRVDRPVAELAISSGRRILLVAALPTALQQTLALLHQIASDAQRSPNIVEVLCRPAWDLFENGDVSGYIAALARTIGSTAVSGDLVLLAQASMAPVAQLVGRSDISVVSSPALGVEAAIAAYRRLE
jgi:hypothetical protein